jgi:hypothetical protein
MIFVWPLNLRGKVLRISEKSEHKNKAEEQRLDQEPHRTKAAPSPKINAAHKKTKPPDKQGVLQKG